MINITKLYCGLSQPADALRYGQGHGAPRSAAERKPIVVWNITRRCNLRCIHCYSDSDAREYPGELTWEQCRGVVDDLAQFGVPGVLLSGGEPLIHPRFFDLAGYARSKGLRLTLSTNGTLIDRAAAQRLQGLDFAYVGISLDGIGATHDYFRGRQGAFEKTVEAFRHCKAVGQKVGLRLTLSAHNLADLDRILDFIEAEDIDRVCFYHLVYSGRGSSVVDVSHAQTRAALDQIIARTARWAASGRPREVLTVDQPADGAYLYLRLLGEDTSRAEQVLDLLRWNGGAAHGSGTGIGNIDTQGNVHPDQFWQTLTLGNVKQRPFSEIWHDADNATLAALRNRTGRLTGQCAGCRFLDICGGGFRVRAVQVHGNLWAPDPACYLTEPEVAGAV
ncbi:MAG TPA: radical SAM protein [Candidatus Saccharimonadales bacterium]|nr:radical SAM protein [Candidatus Saccharimonadales bacterium]